MTGPVTGLDTNVLVRFLTLDDPVQASLAQVAMAALSVDAPGFVAREVMVELVWVLERAYRLPREAIAQALTGLLEAEEVQIEASDRVGAALALYARGGPGFSDQMIRLAAQEAGGGLVTFDRQLAGQAGVRLLGDGPVTV